VAAFGMERGLEMLDKVVGPTSCRPKSDAHSFATFEDLDSLRDCNAMAQCRHFRASFLHRRHSAALGASAMIILQHLDQLPHAVSWSMSSAVDWMKDGLCSIVWRRAALVGGLLFLAGVIGKQCSLCSPYTHFPPSRTYLTNHWTGD